MGLYLFWSRMFPFFKISGIYGGVCWRKNSAHCDTDVTTLATVGVTDMRRRRAARGRRLWIFSNVITKHCIVRSEQGTERMIKHYTSVTAVADFIYFKPQWKIYPILHITFYFCTFTFVHFHYYSSFHFTSSLLSMRLNNYNKAVSLLEDLILINIYFTSILFLKCL